MIEAVLLRLVDQIVTRFTDRFAAKSVDSIFDGSITAGSKKLGLGEVLDRDSVRNGLQGHLTEVDNWSATVHFYGMSGPQDVADSTLPLGLSDTPRKFRAAGARSSKSTSADPSRDPVADSPVVQESDLLNDRAHHLVIGDPGAGKTTTMKRLIRRVLRDVPTKRRAVWHPPILAILRDHGASTSLAEIVLEKLGLAAEVQEWIASFEKATPAARDEALYRMTAAVLDSLGAVLFLDGLDEVHLDARYALEESVLRLSRRLRNAKIIMSMRSGDFARNMVGFKVVEICALTESQIEEISRIWLGAQADLFLKRTADGSVFDLADRPLFLCQMLLLFRANETIPDQPSSLSHQMVRLMLQDWDSQNRVVRGTRYSTFDADAKLAFLANVAFVMTFEMHSQRFTHGEMIDVYGTLCHRFGLPVGEADKVAQEIEAHTGIIVEVGSRGFEFSHLSIQEFLSAHHVVRLADESLLPRLFMDSPATLAIATVLSSDPSRFLANLVHRHRMNRDDLKSYLVRLVQERPRFRGVSPEHLGAAGLSVLLANDKLQDSATHVIDFIRYPGVTEAVNDLISRAYDVDSNRAEPSQVRLRRRASHDIEIPRLPLPKAGLIDQKLFAELCQA